MTKISKRLLSLAVAVMMIISLLPASVMAEEVTGLSGKGTETEPYLINSLAELEWFRDDVNTYKQDGSNQYYQKYVQLNTDIDLAGINWEPIGMNAQNDHEAFLGTFDGNGHTIYNLYVEREGSNLGFFARTSHFDESKTGAYIRNLTFENVTVKSTNSGTHVGGVIGNSEGWTYIDNVEVTGTVDIAGYAYVGGIVGHGYPKMNDCHLKASGNITCDYWCCGGLVGYAGEGGTRVTNCSVVAPGVLTVTTVAGGAAAAVGFNKSDSYYENIDVENVDIVSLGNGYNPDYCLGYVVGNGEESAVISGNTAKNVSLTAGNKEGTATDGEGAVTFLPETVAPKAEVTKYDKQVLTDYKVWDGVAIGQDHLTVGEEELPLNAVVNFKALDTLEECVSGGYAEWLVDFNLTITGLESGSISSEDCYLAGNYGSYGWIVIPANVLVSTLYEGNPYPIISNYESSLNYKDICKSVKNFTAGLCIAPEILDANPNMEIKLELVMTNPADSTDKLQIGEDIAYTHTDLTENTLPKAEVTVLGKQTLEESEYRVWNGVVSDQESEALVPGEGELPLEVVLNFKALDTLEECMTGGYAKWLVDFYITVDGLKDGSVVADKCYMAGNYGSYGWIKIPLDGQTIDQGVTYPVVAVYDPTLNYKDICKSVKSFTAALHIDQAILDANPDMTVTLELKMTNNLNENDVLLIGEPYVYDVDALENGASAQNKETGELYTSAQEAIDGAASGETVVLLRDFAEEEVYVKRERTLDLNGYTLSASDVSTHSTSHIIDSTNGDALLVVEKEYLAVNTNNLQLPVWTDDGETAGYRFTDVEFKHKATMENAGRAYYRFYIAGDDADCMLANELKDGGADNSVSVEVRLSWKDASGHTVSKSYVYTDGNLIDYANNWTGSMFFLYVNGVDSVTDLTVTATIVSSAYEHAEVVIQGETVTPA